MLQLVEMEGKMTENGCIEIPAVVLEQAGICTGDTVKLVYMAEDGELKNTAKEFLLARAGQDVAEELAKEENIAFQIPEELLQRKEPYMNLRSITTLCLPDWTARGKSGISM